MLLLGERVSEVDFSALGLRVIPKSNSCLSDMRKTAVSLAGPAMNWLCWGISVLLNLENMPFANVSLAFALAHTLPIEPLDGGLALRYFLRYMTEDQWAERISRRVSAVLLFPLAVLGFLILIRTRYNYSLLLLSLYLMMYLVLGWDYAQT